MKTYKSMMTQADCVAVCKKCIGLCMDCIGQMEKCPNKNSMHEDCISKCKECMATCQMCISDLSGNTNDMQCIEMCRKCAEMCMNCVENLEQVAQKCSVCKDMCEACSEACADCAETCRMSIGEDVNSENEYSSDAEGRAMKFAVKAVDDWELDVLALPFDKKDSDTQWFDENTDPMPDVFDTPLVVYQHGIEPGAKEYQGKVIVVGKTKVGSLEKKKDGWHVRVILDKLNELSKKIMEAAKRGMVAVSSGSVAHLARLDIGGKLIPYEKDKPGRIAIWPFAEISLWDKGGGNLQPANRFAFALPAIKAIYREAGLRFPEIQSNDALPRATEQVAAKRTGTIRQQALAYLITIPNEE